MQGLQALEPLVAVVEVRRAGDHQVQPGQLLLAQHIHELPQHVEGFFPRLGVHALDGLHLVQHHHQARIARLPQELEQADQKRERGLAVHLALDARNLGHAAVNVGLAAEPSQQALGLGELPGELCPVVGPQHLGEGGVTPRQLGQLVLQALLRGVGEGGIGLLDAAHPADLLAHLEQPAIHDGLEGADASVLSLQALHEPAVHGLEVVQGGVVDGDLHLAGGQAHGPGPRAQKPRGEGLARAVGSADPLAAPKAAGHGRQLAGHGVHEWVEPGGEMLQAPTGNHAATQGADDLVGLVSVHHFSPGGR